MFLSAYELKNIQVRMKTFDFERCLPWYVPCPFDFAQLMPFLGPSLRIFVHSHYQIVSSPNALESEHNSEYDNNELLMATLTW